MPCTEGANLYRGGQGKIFCTEGPFPLFSLISLYFAQKASIYGLEHEVMICTEEARDPEICTERANG